MGRLLKKWWFWLLIVVLIASVGRNGKETKTDTSVSETPKATASTVVKQTAEPTATTAAKQTAKPTAVPTEEPVAAPLTIALDSQSKGDYGRKITLNAETDEEYSFFGFFVPSGKYNAKNDTERACQISFYLDDTEIVDGVEYPKTNSDHRPVVLMSGNSAEITVYDGEYIKLTDGDSVELVKLD